MTQTQAAVKSMGAGAILSVSSKKKQNGSLFEDGCSIFLAFHTWTLSTSTTSPSKDLSSQMKIVGLTLCDFEVCNFLRELKWHAWINHFVYWWSVLKPSQTSMGWLVNLEFPSWGMERKNGKKGNANGARRVSRWNSRIWLSPCNDLHQVCGVGQCQKC